MATYYCTSGKAQDCLKIVQYYTVYTLVNSSLKNSKKTVTLNVGKLFAATRITLYISGMYMFKYLHAYTYNVYFII